MPKSKITSFFKPITDIDNKPVVKVTEVPDNKDESEETEDKSDVKENINANVTPLKRKADDSVEVLSPEQKDRMSSNKSRAQLLRLAREVPLVCSSMGSSWFAALEPQLSSEWFSKLSSFVCREREQHTIYPAQGEVWAWTSRFDIQDTKVVILGQDPYHGPDQAHGLCFSVKPGVKSPPSLGNIYKELASDIEGFTRPSHGCLAGWADQGVLLLNACLTVRAGQANSHKDRGWEKVTDAVVKWISNNCDGVVFLLWGMPAQKKAAVVDTKKHYLLKSVHPSPLSAHRGFLGCKHFSMCNELLEKQGKTPIDWKKLPERL